MKQYNRPTIDMILIEVQDIITASIGIVQSPDKPKSTMGTDVTDGTNIGNIDPNNIF